MIVLGLPGNPVMTSVDSVISGDASFSRRTRDAKSPGAYPRFILSSTLGLLCTGRWMNW